MKYYVEYNENEINEIFEELDHYKKARLTFKEDPEMFRLNECFYNELEKKLENIYLVKE